MKGSQVLNCEFCPNMCQMCQKGNNQLCLLQSAHMIPRCHCRASVKVHLQSRLSFVLISLCHWLELYIQYESVCQQPKTGSPAGAFQQDEEEALRWRWMSKTISRKAQEEDVAYTLWANFQILLLMSQSSYFPTSIHHTYGGSITNSWKWHLIKTYSTFALECRPYM